MPARQGQPASVKSAERVLDILEFLATDTQHTLSQAELGKRLGVPKSSLHALLRVLVARGYVELSPDPASRSYRLGPRVLGLGNAYLATLDLLRAARQVMAAMARLSAETITLDIPYGSAMLTIAREDARQPIQVTTRIGWPFPAHATASGKVVLASLPPEALDRLFPHPELPLLTTRTIRTVDELKAELRAVREAGVAHAHGEINEGVEAVAVPIVDHRCQVVAALDALVPLPRARAEYLRRMERLLRAGAHIISARMGAPGAHASLGVVDPEHYLEQAWGANGRASIDDSAAWRRAD